MIVRGLRYLQKLALAFWLGEMLFFISVFAPRVFRVLPRDMAGQLQNSIFPGYFTVGVACAVTLIVAQLILIALGMRAPARAKPRRQRTDARSRRQVWTLTLSVFAGGIFAYCLWVVTPQLAQLQPQMLANPSAEISDAFQSLHRWSVRLNAAALFALLALLAVV